MSQILHISADYPDPLAPAKTRAVSNLLALIPEHVHRVVSLNRVHRKTRPTALAFADTAGEAHRALAYGAPGKGILLRRYLGRVADWIEADCRADGFRPDVVHAHKLTVEGFVGMALAQRFGARLAVSVQGNTDQKIAGARRDLRPALGAIWRAADVAFPFAPWSFAKMNGLLGARSGPTFALPCPTPGDEILRPEIVGPVVLTACNLKDYDNKNLMALIGAVGQIGRELPDVRLEIMGGGDPAAFVLLERAAREQAPGRVRFLGAVPHAEVQGRFHGAAAFALVSRRESYGMVFAEALLAGAPCMIPRDRGIDGYFEDGSVVVAVDPSDRPGMARGLRALLAGQAEFKARLAELGASGGLRFMQRDGVAAAYRHGLDVALGAVAPDADPGPGVVRLG